jgi:VanZ family protein/Flp pilus assembly pilin Flp
MDSVSVPASPASAFARVGLLVYALLIVYASWYPFSGWHATGLSPLAYLLAPLPHYWTKFDLVTNIIGYIPLGILMVFALYPRMRGIAAVLIVSAAGILLSGTMEAVQTFLPSRVPSNLDLLTNSAGICIGAVTGIALTPVCLEESRFLELRRRWFSAEAGRGLIVLGLWPLAQIYPQSYFLGHGQVMPILSEWLSMPLDLSALFRHGYVMNVEQYWLSEVIITACTLSGALLTLLCVLRIKAPRHCLVFMLAVLAITTKTLANALLFEPDNAFAWLTPGAQGGILLGSMMLAGLIRAPVHAQRRVAVIALVISLVVVNVVPANPYFIATLQTWVQGRFLNFNGAAQFLSLLWPFLMLWFLLHPVHWVKRG